MLDDDNRKVLLSGRVFLYRTKAPFVSSGKSVLGALEYNDSNDTVRCHECGEWFKHVGIHANHSHSLFAREYKQKHGLKQKTALCAESTRKANALKNSPENTSRLREYRCDPNNDLRVRLAVARANRDNPKKDSVEFKNESGRCHAQLLHRLQTLAAKLGHTPSVAELKTAGISPDSLLMNFNVRTMADVMSIVGMIPNKPKSGVVIYSRPVLIELMLDFYAKHQRFPTPSDHRRGLLPDEGCIFKRFGNMRAFYEACGLWEKYQDHREETRRIASRKRWRNFEPSKREEILARLNVGREAAKERGVNMGRRSNTSAASSGQ